MFLVWDTAQDRSIPDRRARISIRGENRSREFPLEISAREVELPRRISPEILSRETPKSAERSHPQTGLRHLAEGLVHGDFDIPSNFRRSFCRQGLVVVVRSLDQNRGDGLRFLSPQAQIQLKGRRAPLARTKKLGRRPSTSQDCPGGPSSERMRPQSLSIPPRLSSGKHSDLFPNPSCRPIGT